MKGDLLKKMNLLNIGLIIIALGLVFIGMSIPLGLIINNKKIRDKVRKDIDQIDRDEERFK